MQGASSYLGERPAFLSESNLFAGAPVTGLETTRREGLDCKNSTPVLPQTLHAARPRFSWEEIFFPAIDSGPALCSTQGLLGLNIEHAKRATAPRVGDHAQQKRGRDDLT